METCPAANMLFRHSAYPTCQPSLGSQVCGHSGQVRSGAASGRRSFLCLLWPAPGQLVSPASREVVEDLAGDGGNDDHTPDHAGGLHFTRCPGVCGRVGGSPTAPPTPRGAAGATWCVARCILLAREAERTASLRQTESCIAPGRPAAAALNRPASPRAPAAVVQAKDSRLCLCYKTASLVTQASNPVSPRHSASTSSTAQCRPGVLAASVAGTPDAVLERTLGTV
jgi:hypothetical protein